MHIPHLPRALVALCLVAAGAEAQQLVSYEAGTAGSPAVAPDPQAQGWSLVYPAGSGVQLADVSPDGATGLNAWAIHDQGSAGGERAHYEQLLTSQQVADAFQFGWELEVRLRVLQTNGLDIVVEFAEGQAGSDRRYLAWYEAQGSDLLVTLSLSGTSYVCPGGMDGAYHTFLYRKAPGAIDAELLYDGQLLGSFPAGGSNGGAPAGGVSFGTGSSGGQGSVHVHSVRFTAGEPDVLYTDLFASGTGYASYRIPALLATSAGSVLAFAEGRVVASDHAQNDIVMRRSADGGNTWAPMVVLDDDGANSLNNPCVVQVREGPHTGRILLMYQRYPEGCHESCVVPGYVGSNVCRSFVMHSDDDGLTWSARREVTQEVKRPTIVTSIAGGPGVAIQKRRAPNQGRLIVPFNQGPAGAWKVYAAYSDDGGDSWAWGAVADDTLTAGVGNEVQMVELEDGSLLLNARNYGGTSHRKVARSFDGGLSWTPLADELELIEPGCMASVLRYTDSLDGYLTPRLLYAGPNSTTSRVNGTIHVSYDEGETWPVSRSIYPGGYAYSVLGVMPDGRIGCLFERDGYARITLARLDLDWLTGGADCLDAGVGTYCTTSPNSVGNGAMIGSSGTVSIAHDDFQLRVDSARPHQFGLFFYSDGTTEVPFGDGVLCVAPGSFGFVRTTPVQADLFGSASHDLDLPASPFLTAGQRYHFQFWYRDPGGPGGSGYNTSDALVVEFCP